MPLEHSLMPSTIAQSPAPESAWHLEESGLNRLRRLSSVLGLPLAAYDPETDGFLNATDGDPLPTVPAGLVSDCAASREPRVLATATGLVFVAIPLTMPAQPELVAVGYMLTGNGQPPADLVVAAADRGWTPGQFDAWIGQRRTCDPQTLLRLAELAVEEMRRGDRERGVDEYTRIAEQLDHTYEELNLLHTLTQSMHISRSPREIVTLSLERLDAVIQAGGHAIWLDDKRDGRLFLIQGVIPFDEVGMARLIARFDGHDWPRPLIRNHVAGTLLGADFPRLRNFALVPVADGSLRFGWILSCNLGNNGDFGSIQTSLLSSVASILATHQHNLELYRQHEDLLLSFVRSLVSTLDAKDAYTRGHSERVAIVGRRLGAQLGLPEDDLRNIYLAGLLHDIGKIGIDDQVLQKPGQLTREEFEQIKKHPVIGYNILAGLKNLQGVLPGVRHHHESFAGTGYPDGLQGDEIPLMARIIAVADSYDAMISDRPYRSGLKLDKLETILRDGSGNQWDPRVISAYFSIRDEIRLVRETYSPAGGDLLRRGFPQMERLAEELDPVHSIESIRGTLGSL